MKRIFGVFRGFPGLGRVVSGVSLLEMLRDRYGYETKAISYLQGNKYLETKGYLNLREAVPMDYCSIGLLPTNRMGSYIFDTIKEYRPNVIIIDGEPLIIQALKISYPDIKVVALLNPADVDNPQNDKEAMDYFNAMYSLSDLAIVHGLRKVNIKAQYNKFVSIGTILRNEILSVKNNPGNNIYCLLGGGTVNVGHQFVESTIKIGELCILAANELSDHYIHLICSSNNIYDALNENRIPHNVFLHKDVLDATEYYTDAGLVITRSGRNTLSELAYLGIPAISFISGCSFRKNEQEQNMKNTDACNIEKADLSITPSKLADLCRIMIKKKRIRTVFECGNTTAIQEILSICK